MSNIGPGLRVLVLAGPAPPGPDRERDRPHRREHGGERVHAADAAEPHAWQGRPRWVRYAVMVTTITW